MYDSLVLHQLPSAFILANEVWQIKNLIKIREIEIIKCLQVVSWQMDLLGPTSFIHLMSPFFTDENSNQPVE